MFAYKTDRDKRCCEHLEHHGDSKKGLKEELGLSGIDVAYRVESCTLDNEEKKRYADLEISLIARTELFVKNEERSRAQNSAGYVFYAKAPYSSDRKETYEYQKEAH